MPMVRPSLKCAAERELALELRPNKVACKKIDHHPVQTIVSKSFTGGIDLCNYSVQIHRERLKTYPNPDY